VSIKYLLRRIFVVILIGILTAELLVILCLVFYIARQIGDLFSGTGYEKNKQVVNQYRYEVQKRHSREKQ
jgi:hypothetical protein